MTVTTSGNETFTVWLKVVSSKYNVISAMQSKKKNKNLAYRQLAMCLMVRSILL